MGEATETKRFMQNSVGLGSFVVTLVITEKVLAYPKGLSIKLQGRYIDAVRAHSDIESVKSTLSRCRSQVDDFHMRLWGGSSIRYNCRCWAISTSFSWLSATSAKYSCHHCCWILQIKSNNSPFGSYDQWAWWTFNTESSAIVTGFSQPLLTALYNKSVSEKLTKANFSRLLWRWSSFLKIFWHGARLMGSKVGALWVTFRLKYSCKSLTLMQIRTIFQTFTLTC